MPLRKKALQRWGGTWLNFWYFQPSPHTLAALRMSVGVILLYTLLVRSYDLEFQLASRFLGDPAVMQKLDGIAWPFSYFNWFNADGWLWSVHVLAIVSAVAFTLGVVPTISGTLCLSFLLSYAHRNPAVVLDLDGLLMLSIAYLVLMPCGACWSLPGTQLYQATPLTGPAPQQDESKTNGGPIPWSGIVLRALQLHLCIRYFQSGLINLNNGWLEGTALWHPRLVEKATPLAISTLEKAPYLLRMIPTGIVLFELYFCALIWVPWLRYPVLISAALLHLSVGIFWEKLPFNLLMIALSIVFVPPQHLRFVMDELSLLLRQGWRFIMDSERL